MESKIKPFWTRVSIRVLGVSLFFLGGSCGWSWPSCFVGDWEGFGSDLAGCEDPEGSHHSEGPMAHKEKDPGDDGSWSRMRTQIMKV